MRRKLYFTNARGESVLIDGSTHPLLLSKLEGIGGAPAEIQMQKAPYQDGMTYIDTVLGPRYLSVEGAIWSLKPDEVMDRRQKLVRVFNPKLGLGRLRLEIESTAWEIDAIAESSPVFPDRGGAPIQRFLVSFVCPDPAWRDPVEERWTLASLIGGFTFPFSFPIQLGIVGQSLVIENRGDLETPVLIRMHGPLGNPTLTNETTGKKLSIVRKIQTGETLEINTAFGKKSVTIIDAARNRSNGFYYVAPDSEFWQVIPGENWISYTATEESPASSVTLSFFHRYAGV